MQVSILVDMRVNSVVSFHAKILGKGDALIDSAFKSWGPDSTVMEEGI